MFCVKGVLALRGVDFLKFSAFITNDVRARIMSVFVETVRMASEINFFFFSMTR